MSKPPWLSRLDTADPSLPLALASLVAQDLATQRSARSRYESDAWDSHQSLGSRERAGGDVCGSLTASRPERDSGWASGSRSGGSPHWQSS